MKGTMVSIIIPVYNTQEYLKKCLDSVVNQSYANIEIIIINDGSTDGSHAICIEHAKKDNRIILIDKENKGVSAARNTGIDIAKGELFIFVDSDDYIGNDYIFNLVNKVKSDIDLVIGGFLCVDSYNNNIDNDYLKFKDEIVGLKDYDILFDKLAIFNFGYPFSKVFKKNIIKENNIYFDEDIKMFEDTIFLLKYLNFCNLGYFCSNQDYFYRKSNIGLSSKIHDFSSEYKAFSEFKNIINNKFGISDSQIVDEFPKIGVTIVQYMERSIISLYRNKYSYNQRIRLLRKISSDYWYLYSVFYNPKSLVKLALKKLYINNRFYVASAISIFAYKIL